jgi:signal transduction histidine kinase
MRRRLLTVFLSLLVAVCLGLALPLCGAIASSNTAEMVLDRSSDTTRFASLAGPALESGETGALAAELVAYDSLYQIHTAVLDRHGDVAVTSRSARRPEGPEIREQVRAALAGSRGRPAEVLWPWDGEPLVVVEPVVRSGEVIGAVVTVSSTDALHARTLRQWGTVLAVVVLVLALGTAAAGPLGRWVLRPVHDLDQATRSISAGRLSTRVPAEGGPPELRRLSDSFNRMADTVTTLLERQRAFVAYAGHQVRNPLAALRLRVDGLAAHLRPSGAGDHALTLDEVDRLTRICDSLLELAHAEPDGLTGGSCDVRAVAEARVEAWQPIARRNGMELQCCGTSGAQVGCPEGTVGQVLDVLIDNALKFAGAGVRVSVHVGKAGPHGRDVHVVDDGPGLEDEQLAAAVTPFWRSEDGRGPAGVGLGLAIVVELLALHGGELDLARAEPHGIDARVRLPLAGGPDEPDPHPEE